MLIALTTQFNIYLPCLFRPVQHSVLNLNALVGSFNPEKALVGAFSVIVKTDGSFAALVNTEPSREPRPSYNQQLTLNQENIDEADMTNKLINIMKNPQADRVLGRYRMQTLA